MTKLTPAAGVEAAEAGWWLAPTSPMFDVAVDPASIRGGWVECDVSVATELKPARPALIATTAGAPLSRVRHEITTDAAGRGRWVGYLPDDVERLGFEPIDGPGRFRIESFSLRRLGFADVLRRALVVDPLRAARAVFWRLAKRRLRSRHLLRDALAPRPIRRVSKPGRAYDRWIAQHDTFSAEDLAALGRAVEAWPDPPLISVLMPVYNPAPRDLDAAIASIRGQIYGRWELRIADDASSDRDVLRVLDEAARSDQRIHVARRSANGHISAATNTALEAAKGCFCALMDHDDLLPAHALLFVARELVEHPEADLVYTDEDKVDGRGRRHMPHFKPAWNEELFLAQNYVNHLAVFRTELLRRVGGFRVGLEGSQDHDLILRLLDHTTAERIRHVPRILYHWRRGPTSFSEASTAEAVATRRRALSDHVERRGWDAAVVAGAAGANRLARRLRNPPEVTVILATRDAADLVAVSTRGVLHETDYARLKLLLVDNGSTEPATASLFADLRRDPRVTILARPGPFNFSALNNDAVASSDSGVICFLNNDVEVIEPGWLTEMVSGLSDQVAAVGAKLLFPDRTIQHAGVILGAGGVAGHSHANRPGSDGGYYGRAVLPQHLSAVTAACMVVRREAFLAVGGFDAEHLTVAFNDVDLCLKLGARGFKVLFDPYAVLIHHESATRGLDIAPEKRARFEREVNVMLDRWGALLRRDPCYNPNLSLDFADFRLRGVDPRGPPKARRRSPS